MPKKEYDCLAIVDGDNTIRSIRRHTCGSIDIGKFTAFVQARLLTESARTPLLIWCQTLMSSDPKFSERNSALEHCGWRIRSTSGAIEKDDRTGFPHWRGLPDSFIAQEARKTLAKYRIRRMLLASGDGYFVPLIRQANEHFVHTIVLSISKALHHQLCAAANEVIEIEQHLDDILGADMSGKKVIAGWRIVAERLANSRRPLISKRARKRRRR